MIRCRNPFIDQAQRAFPCGQCPPCRVSKRREWSSRIELESRLHLASSFVTLTYDEEHLPRDLSLDKSHFQKFMKRWRKSNGPVRYFACGEYGTTSHRPHYHAVIFGLSGCRRGNTDHRGSRSCCDVCDRIRSTWGMGFIQSQPYDNRRIGDYIAGYVTKKLTRRQDSRLERPDGTFRDPEFSIMSLKPGIGLGIVPAVAETFLKHVGPEFDDVPTTLSRGSLKLGRYLTRALRVECGRDPSAPQATLDKSQAPLQPLREAARNDKKNPSFKAKILEANEQIEANRLSREKIHGQRKDKL